MSAGVLVSYLSGTLTGGGAVPQAVSAANPLPVTIASASGLLTVQGPAATGTALAGNPVRVGAAFNTVLPVATTGQAVDLQASASGILYSATTNTAGVAITTSTNPSQTGVTNNGTFQTGVARQWLYNGATWDAYAKAQTPFKLPSSAATNNAANVKAAAGTLQSFSAFNTQAVTRFAKFFNSATAPNPAALAQYDLVALPQGQTIMDFGATGEYFNAGIGFAIVANPADLDNTAIGAGDIVAAVVRFS